MAPIAQPLLSKYDFELNIKSLCLSMSSRSVVIILVGMFFLGNDHISFSPKQPRRHMEFLSQELQMMVNKT